MLPEPWYFTAQDLSQQLHIELHNDHILKGNKQKLSLAGKITIMYYLKWIMRVFSCSSYLAKSPKVLLNIRSFLMLKNFINID